ALRLGYVRCLGAFLPLRNFEFDLIAFLQALIAFGTNCAVVNKYIGPVFPPDESITFCVVKPLYCAFHTIHLPAPPHRHIPCHHTCLSKLCIFILRRLAISVKARGGVLACIHAGFNVYCRNQSTPAMVLPSRIFPRMIIRTAADKGNSRFRIASSLSG